WNRWSTFGNILIGAVALGVTSFTGIIDKRHSTLNKIVWAYGLTILLGGIMNGVWPKAMGMRAVARQAQTFRAAPPAMNNGIYPTPTGIPYAKILA
ncbi:MAG: hypothetical protein NT129_06715, partial [Candidatus Aenigmarchaeota archaeon]|nr:hypothetical protein [Candidatus Aenigmarchaeota archaeon]